MNSLYEISNEYQSLLEKTYDPETGEIFPQVLDKLDEISAKIEDKAIAVASYIKNLDAEREAIEKAKKNMAEREARLDKRADYLTQYLQSNMERCGITEIKSPMFVIKLKKCPFSTDIIDENIIPDDYKKTKEVVTIDRLKLKEELQAGVIVPGAALKQNNRLEIR
jgi:outer membrane murein-binding lipoprotein Lpp